MLRLRAMWNHSSQLGGLLAGMLCIVAGGAPAQTPATLPSVEDIAVQSSFPAQMSGVSEEVLLQWQAKQAHLQQAVAHAHGLELAQARLALANWQLAVPAAQASTLWVAGLADDEQLDFLARWGDEAGRQVEQALAQLRELKRADLDKESWRHRRQLMSAARTLRAYAALPAALRLRDNDEAFAEACHDSALGLAVARESADEQLAAAAKLWQSFALELAGRRERVLRTLDDVLKTPAVLPYDFMGRLLRCRIVVAEGNYAAGLALYLRMYELSGAWFRLHEEEKQVDSAHRLILSAAMNAGRQWSLHTSDSALAEDIEELNGKLQRLMNEPSNAIAMYRMEFALPIIVEPITMDRSIAQTAPASEPASRPVTGNVD